MKLQDQIDFLDKEKNVLNPKVRYAQHLVTAIFKYRDEVSPKFCKEVEVEIDNIIYDLEKEKDFE